MDGAAKKELMDTEIATLILSSSGLAAVAVKLIEVLYDALSKRKKQQREEAAADRAEMLATLEKLNKELDENKADTLVLMHDRIYQMFKVLSTQETITAEDKANIDYLWQRYSARGGNHNAEVLYEVIDKIPVVSGK